MTLTDEQLNELCEIGAKYIYTGIKNERHLTWGGVHEIIKRYEKMKKDHDAKLSTTIAKWDDELKENGQLPKYDPHFCQRDMNGDPLKYWGGLSKEVTFDEINNQSINYPEILDEDIKKIASDYVLYNDAKRNWVIEGMKLYREQLKTK